MGHLFSVSSRGLVVLSVYISFLYTDIFIAIFSLFILAPLFLDGARKYFGVYFLFLMFSLLGGLFGSEFLLISYLFSIITFVAIFFWFLSGSHRISLELVHSFMYAHVAASFLQLPLQFLQLFMAYGLDWGVLFSNSSAGDIAVGTLGHSGVLAYKAIISVFFLMLLKGSIRKSRFIFLLSSLLLSFFIVGSNHTLIALGLVFLLEAVYGVFVVFFARLSNLKFSVSSVLVGVAGFMLLLILTLSASSQVEYIYNSVRALLDSDFMVGKVVAYLNTYKLFAENIGLLVVGVGVGEYASRASFMLSGSYLRSGELPFIGAVYSQEFLVGLSSLWTDSIKSNPAISGTMFQPFSSHLTLIAELGMILYVLFSVYLFRIIFVIKKDVYARGLFLFFYILMFFENIFEFVRVSIPVIFVLGFYYRQMVRLQYSKLKISFFHKDVPLREYV